MGLKSLATVHKHITNLEKKGLLDRVHNRSRSIDVLPPGTRTRSSDRLPLAGRIAAGFPVEAMENAGEHLAARRGGQPRRLCPRGARRLDARRAHHQRRLCAGGAHAHGPPGRDRGGPGAWRRDHPEALLYRRATWCGCSRPTWRWSPIYVPAAQVAIQGRVLGVLRKYR